jgi:branched-chain amino acid transport system ATP-binding protein
MLLEVDKLEAGYGLSQALFGLSLAMREGEVITLLGRNGMGKSTTVKCISGLNPVSRGEIRFRAARIDGLPSYRICHLGIGLVPEGRHIFPNLTVRENLEMAAIARSGRAEPWTMTRVLDLFPRLGERLANGGNQLSGGEQQMLAISRALMTNPDLLVLDEATEGLSPQIRKQIWEKLAVLKGTGLSMLVIDKEIESLCRIADRHYILEKGEIVWSGTSDELLADESVQHAYLSV